jgi:hypothetical protein
MATITYLYPVNTTVFYMNATTGVEQAVVRAITANISQNGSTLAYDVAFSKPTLGSKIVNEITLYADVDLALAAYKLTVLV